MKLLGEAEYVSLIADLINRDSDLRRRNQRVREANRKLHTLLVGGSAVQADLALAQAAAQKERP